MLMKCSFYSDDFKAACDRASAVSNLKSPCMEYKSIHFIASEKELKVIGKSYGMHCIIVIPAIVVEPGNVSIEIDSVKKLFNVKGEVELICENNNAKLTNGKKVSFVPYYTETEYDGITLDDYSITGKFDEKDFVSDLGLMFPFTDDSATHDTLTGCFCFDTNNDSIVALDGQTVCHKSNVGFSPIGKAYKVPSNAYAHLKKITGKSNMKIGFGSNENHDYVAFKGNDYEYIIRCKEGTYFDYKSFFESAKGGCVHGDFDCNEMHSIASEYNGLVKNAKIPMIFKCDVTKNKFSSAVSVGSYITSDRIDATIISKSDWYSGLSPYYLKIAMDVFKKKSERVDFELNPKTEMNISPFILSCDDWNIAILAVRLSSEYLNNVMSVIE